jgi:hypothetical protein
LLLLGLDELKRLGLKHPTATEVLEALGAGRTQAYAHKKTLHGQVAELSRPAGRPRHERPVPVQSCLSHEVTRAVLEFILATPGCAHRATHRTRYSAGFRRFIIELRTKHESLALSDFAQATQVPLGTLEQWLTRAKPPASSEPHSSIAPFPETIPQIETVIHAWRNWKGDFTTFCHHVKKHLRINRGPTWIGDVLDSHGERPRPPRGSGRRQAEACRGSFETFFPGAQWVGDGKVLKLRINGQDFKVNLELMVDADSGAKVGACITQEETTDAVNHAFTDGVQTTGTAPLGVLLDNKSCNYSDDLNDGLKSTIVTHSTVGRAQNKAPVEGAFGLFSQTAPKLEIHAHDGQSLAEQIAVLLVTIWGRASNHRPRKNRDGKSAAKLYQEASPTEDEIKVAKKKLRERQRQQELRAKQREARLDPVTRTFVEDALNRLGLEDPKGRFRDTLSTYPLDDVVDGVSIFEGRKTNESLPRGVDARYLIGIVKNIFEKREGLAVAEALLTNRLKLRDLALSPLLEERERIIHTPGCSLNALVDRASKADRYIDRLFWVRATIDYIGTRETETQTKLLDRAMQRVHAAFEIDYPQRQALVLMLADRAIPIQKAP